MNDQPIEETRIPIEEDRTGLTPETALDRALRDARIRAKKHYAVSGHSIEIHKGDKPVVVGRRTITAAVGKYDDEPRGGGAKEAGPPPEAHGKDGAEWHSN